MTVTVDGPPGCPVLDRPTRERVGRSAEVTGCWTARSGSSARGGRAWVAAGGYLGGRVATDPGAALDARLAELVADAAVVRADASDRMPPAFGSDAYWALMADWAAGLVSPPDLLDELDAQRAFTGG